MGVGVLSFRAPLPCLSLLIFHGPKSLIAETPTFLGGVMIGAQRVLQEHQGMKASSSSSPEKM